MVKKVKFIILGIIALSVILVFFLIIIEKNDSNSENDDVYIDGPIVESMPTEKLVIPLTQYDDIMSMPPGILLDYYDGWEKLQIEMVRGELRLGKVEGLGKTYNIIGNKYEINKDNPEEIFLISSIDWNETDEGEGISYAYITFLEDEHIVAQSFVIIREDMEIVMKETYEWYTRTYYATPIKEVKYEKIDGKYQNVTKEYADAWFNSNMEEYEIKKAVETTPEKSRFKIIEDYSTEYKKTVNDDEVYELKGIGIEYEIENDRQYVEAVTDNGEVAVWKEDNLRISTNQKVERLSGTSMICWLDSENLEKDKYNDRVAYLKLAYRENLKVLGLALIKIEYKDDTKTSYTTQIKEVTYELLDGRSQYISDTTKEAWFERAISKFEQEETP